MVLTVPSFRLTTTVGRAASFAPTILTLLLLASVLGLIAWSYLGTSSSPYGTCYGTSGRSVPCELVKRAR